MSAFAPAGEVALWVAAYRVLQRHGVDDVVTYEELGNELGIDPQAGRRRIQHALRRASMKFERLDKHAVEAVPNVGYRVVRPDEHLRLGRGQQRRAGRALARGHSKAINVDLSGVDGETRKGLMTLAEAFRVQGEINRRLSSRQSEMEATLEQILPKTYRHEQELVELRERLERVEQQ